VNAGNGLLISGGGFLVVDFPIIVKASNFTVHATDHLNQFVINAASLTVTLDRSNTLFNGFGFWVYAYNACTIAINAADNFKGGAGGASISLPANSGAWITTDTTGVWYASVWLINTGVVVNPNPPPSSVASFYAYNPGIGQSLGNGTLTLAAVDTEIWDTGNFFNTSTHLWTPPAGKVLMRAQASYTLLVGVNLSANSEAEFFVGISKNGSITNSSYQYLNVGTTGPTVGLNSELVTLDNPNGTDTYGAYIRADGITANVRVTTLFQGTMI